MERLKGVQSDGILQLDCKITPREARQIGAILAVRQSRPILKYGCYFNLATRQNRFRQIEMPKTLKILPIFLLWRVAKLKYHPYFKIGRAAFAFASA